MERPHSGSCEFSVNATVIDLSGFVTEDRAVSSPSPPDILENDQHSSFIMADLKDSTESRWIIMRSFRLFMLLILTVGAAVAFSQTGDHKDAAQAGAQGTPAASQQSAVKTTDQAFKNIQSLKGVPADELIPTMQYFSASLGVGCNYCHVEQGADLAFDERR